MSSTKTLSPNTGMNFGASTAISGSCSLVGAPGSGNDTGAVYSYKLRYNGKKIVTSCIYPCIQTGGDAFGAALAVDRLHENQQMKRIVVGAPRFSTDAGQPGNAFVFVSYDHGRSWTQECDKDGLLAAANKYCEDKDDMSIEIPHHAFFGSAVAIEGNYIAVGAFGYSCNGWQTGAVFVFYKDDTEWVCYKHYEPPVEDMICLPTFSDVASTIANSHKFGYSVSIVHNGCLAVGAYKASTHQRYHSGAVYLYDASDTSSSSPIQRMQSNDPKNYDYFGFSVSLFIDKEDENNPGMSIYTHADKLDCPETPYVSKKWLVIGAPNRDICDDCCTTSIRSYGRAFVFFQDSDDADWVYTELKTTALKATDLLINGFGSAVSIFNDTLYISGRGAVDVNPQPIVVGFCKEKIMSDEQCDSCAGFVIGDHQWTLTTTIHCPQASLSFGYSLGLGATYLSVGAPLESKVGTYLVEKDCECMSLPFVTNLHTMLCKNDNTNYCHNCCDDPKLRVVPEELNLLASKLFS